MGAHVFKEDEEVGEPAGGRRVVHHVPHRVGPDARLRHPWLLLCMAQQPVGLCLAGPGLTVAGLAGGAVGGGWAVGAAVA